ncbi:MAG: phosphoglycerate kinase [Alphaproteobacteria bacterium]|nr:MAG: phosphoglycerate kinase [Alphaproteobacteria bacterium]
MPRLRRIADLGEIAGKTLLVRLDLNVPMQDGRISDDTRIRTHVPTIRTLRERGARLALLSHFGRPRGKVVPEMSLRPLLPALEAAFGEPVGFASDCIGEAARQAIAAAEGLVLLENVRFHPGEEANDPTFARELAALGAAYVNDAFSAAHRAHASTEGVAHLLPAAAGEAMAREIDALERALGKPERPLTAIVGGAKISTKLAVLGHLAERVDHLVIGGGMANTFLLARGFDIGTSLAEHDLVETARQILQHAEGAGCTVHLPSDVVVARALAPRVSNRVVPVDAVRDAEMILDIGPKSVAALVAVLEESKTLIWNGPLGAFEVPPFDRATVMLAQEAARLTRQGSLLSVAGGGDTVAALNTAGVAQDFSHVSTAGGAFLEWMEGKTLPGVAVLMA